jgi:hypothetical protein
VTDLVLLPEARAAATDVSPMDLRPLGGATVPEVPLSQGGSLNHVVPGALKKVARLAATGNHVIGDVKFGAGRFTACAGCDFRIDGARSDEAMSFQWASHVNGFRYGRGGRSGPVERVLPDAAGLRESDEADEDD